MMESGETLLLIIGWVKEEGPFHFWIVMKAKDIVLKKMEPIIFLVKSNKFQIYIKRN
jgi:hypothetical protein